MISTFAIAVSVGLTANVCPNVDSPYGINFHAPAGSALITLINEVEALGLDWIRVDFDWWTIEFSKGLFNWTRHDAIVAEAEARGLLIFATLAYTPLWATSGELRVGVPDDPQDWYDFVYEVVRRYDGRQGKGYIGYWGMWNEPNLSGFWAGTRQEYIDIILNNGANAVKAANPYARVVAPTLAHSTSSGREWYFWLKDCIEQAGDRIDIVAHNTYGIPYTRVRDLWEASTWFGNNPSYWGFWGQHPSLKEVLQYTGWFATGKPVWITEVGWMSDYVGESDQALYYTQLLNDWFTGNPARDWIDKVFFYELNDTQAFPDYSFGVLGRDPDFPRKEAFYAYQNFIADHPIPPALPGPVIRREPSSSAIDVPYHSTVLSWDWRPEACPPEYHVHFGTTSPGDFQATQSGDTFDPGLLDPLTTYYWRIDTENDAGTTTGEVWSFTTAPIAGDFDRDGDVDLEDFGLLQRCYGASPLSGDCVAADLNNDGVVNQADFEIFRACFSGADVPADPACGILE